MRGRQYLCSRAAGRRWEQAGAWGAETWKQDSQNWEGLEDMSGPAREDGVTKAVTEQPNQDQSRLVGPAFFSC